MNENSNSCYLSVIICTYNREKYLRRCLDSFSTQVATRNPWELVIVNNKSTDNSDTIIKDFVNQNQHLNSKYFFEKKQGLSYARNRGILESKGKYLIFIDDDAFASTDYLQSIEYSLSHLPETCAFGGKIIPFLESPLPDWMSPFLHSTISIIDLGVKTRLFPKSKYPIGANMGFSASVIDKIGNFNENLGRVGKNMIGGEEKDFFLRTKNEKISIYYLPNMLVSHVIPSSRLQKSFLKKLGVGVGLSEKIRTRNQNYFSYVNRLLLEIYKWVGTIVISILYMVKLQPSKGLTLIQYRWWISKGLIYKSGAE